ncbi:MAG: triose-phosphate isomerase [Chlamydiales bacterium]|nr:triose-phosphate isomerase [Chlamydiales bacterium]NCF70519.1 triose-phosphate isomerase [Chlamydiales bacterium]
MTRKPLIAGNWKMYKTIDEALAFVKNFLPLLEDDAHSKDVYISVPFTAIHPTSELIQDTSLKIGAQNMNDASEGAYTGEIAARMIENAGASFVVLGHSERRQYFNEDDLFINRKVCKAMESNLEVILCIGESLQQREDGLTQSHLKAQIEKGLEAVDASLASRITLAYEPIWAIGTGKSASAEQAEETHAYCRQVLSDIWTAEAAQKVRILYGGSVKPANIAELMNQENIDGALVGGASLSHEEFIKIVKYDSLKV